MYWLTEPRIITLDPGVRPDEEINASGSVRDLPTIYQVGMVVVYLCILFFVYQMEYVK